MPSLLLAACIQTTKSRRKRRLSVGAPRFELGTSSPPGVCRLAQPHGNAHSQAEPLPLETARKRVTTGEQLALVVLFADPSGSEGALEGGHRQQLQVPTFCLDKSSQFGQHAGINRDRSRSESDLIAECRVEFPLDLRPKPCRSAHELQPPHAMPRLTLQPNPRRSPVDSDRHGPP
jgi:hypothetical protein